MVIVNGVWQSGVTIFDVADNLKEGDIILKGANAVDLTRRRAAILVSHSKGGTIAIAMQAVTGRRVRLILPVGLEKRVTGDLDRLAGILNVPGAHGPRLFPAHGEIITEIEALSLLTGVTADRMVGRKSGAPYADGAAGDIPVSARSLPETGGCAGGGSPGAAG